MDCIVHGVSESDTTETFTFYDQTTRFSHQQQNKQRKKPKPTLEPFVEPPRRDHKQNAL